MPLVEATDAPMAVAAPIAVDEDAARDGGYYTDAAVVAPVHGRTGFFGLARSPVFLFYIGAAETGENSP